MDKTSPDRMSHNTAPLRCPKCGTQNRQGARFCTACSGMLSATASPRPGAPDTQPDAFACPQCGAVVRSAGKFCPNCGSALPAVSNAVAHTAEVGRSTAIGPTVGDLSAASPPPARASDRMPSPHARKLLVHWPGGETEEHPLAPPVIHADGTARVGRAADNDIVLTFPTVSGHHLLLEIGLTEVRVTDLHSTNGTMLKGNLIPSGTPHVWLPGDTLRVGDLHGNSISMSLVGSGRPEVASTRYMGMHGLAQHERILIGRDPTSQIRLAHPLISRHHAEIVKQGGTHLIRDLGSVNGTFVNGARVTSPVPLKMGDVIQLGPYKLVYDGVAASLATSISQGHRLDAMALGTEVSGGKMILNDISMCVQGGEFVALVGGSGAGKSTLLKAMNGFRPATHGRMLIDGEPLYPNLATYRTLMGYVPQDDIIHKTLPVRAALRYSAQLRLPDATPAEIDKRIEDVLEMVDMTAHQDKPVRVLSGGQRKRVSIAVELLAEPDLLFLDEPTSGLDPGLEKKMMYDLNRLADQGRTILLVTHATANIEQCDHVAFLVRGNLAYYGPPRDATTFFEARDFAEIYLKLSEEISLDAVASGGNSQSQRLPARIQPYIPVVRSRSGSEETVPAGMLWAEHYRASPIYHQFVTHRQQQLDDPRQASHPLQVAKPRRTRDSALRQMYILARRQIDLIRHDPRTLLTLALMMPLIAVLFAVVSEPLALVGRGATDETLTRDLLNTLGIESEDELTPADVGAKEEYLPVMDAQPLVTMLSLSLTQAGTLGAAYEIVKEQAIFKREKSVNLRVGAYVLSKALVLAAFSVIQVASVLLILSLKVDMRFDPILDIFPSGALELFVTLLFGVLSGVMFGLFVSAIIPSQDIVLYIVLVQMFVQILMSGAIFDLGGKNPITNFVTPYYWTADTMGAIVDIQQLNEASRMCAVVEVPVPTPQGVTDALQIDCRSAKMARLILPYEHTQARLLRAWLVLGAQSLVWCIATIVVQARAKSD